MSFGTRSAQVAVSVTARAGRSGEGTRAGVSTSGGVSVATGGTLSLSSGVSLKAVIGSVSVRSATSGDATGFVMVGYGSSVGIDSRATEMVAGAAGASGSGVCQ